MAGKWFNLGYYSWVDKYSNNNQADFRKDVSLPFPNPSNDAIFPKFFMKKPSN